MNVIDKAAAFAAAAHAGQKRDDGQDYIVHPAQTAELVAIVTDDEEVIAAAWLHDVIEDTPYTYRDLQLRFGRRVADLVNEVTHEEHPHGNYFPRLRTREGILIKFADRMSNLSNMKTWNDKRKAHYLRRSKFWYSEAQ